MFAFSAYFYQGGHPQAERVEGKMKYTAGRKVECIFFLDLQTLD